MPARTRTPPTPEEQLAVALDAMATVRGWLDRAALQVAYLQGTLLSGAAGLDPARNPRLQILAATTPAGKGGSPDLDGLAEQVADALGQDGEDALWATVLRRAAIRLDLRARSTAKPRAPRTVRDPLAANLTRGSPP